MEEKLYNIDAERRVLASMLHYELACIEASAQLRDEDFSNPIHRIIFDTIKKIYANGTRPTYIELLNEIDRLKILQTPEDTKILGYIARQIIEENNINYWINKVKEASKCRWFYRFLQNYTNKLIHTNEEPDIILKQAEDDLSSALALDFEETVDSAKDIAEFGANEAEQRALRYREIQEKNKGVLPLDGLTTGFDGLNNVTLGYKPGDLIIIGAQTGHGKTALAMHTAKHIAVYKKQPLLYLNTEMSRTQIALRWGSILSGVEHNKIRSGELTSNELSDVLVGYGRLSEAPFWCYPCPNLTPDKMLRICRKFKMQHDIEMVILDYVGRMEKRDQRLQEWQMLEDIVKSCKILAQNLQIAVMVLVQLNDDGTLQGAKRMKNECDLMLKLLPFEDLSAKQQASLKQFNTNYVLYVDKNRDGKSGVVIPIYFDKDRQTFKDADII